MRILYLHQYFVEPTGSGGTRSYEFARRMARDGHDVTVVTSTAFLGPERSIEGSVTRFDLDGVEVIALPVPYGNDFGVAKRLGAFAKFALRSIGQAVRSPRPDVIFATSTPLTIIVPALAARLRHRRNIVFEVRDLWPSIPIAMGYLNGRVPRALARLLERVAYRSAHSVVALSPGMADGVRNVRPSADVTVIPNSSDLELYDSAQNAGKPNGWPELGERPVITYAGTIGAANDLAWLIDVAAAWPDNDDTAIVVVGTGRDRVDVERSAVERDLSQRVFFLDPVAKQDMPGVLANTDVALSLFANEPLLETTSPNKFFDALASSTPVAINYGGWQADLLAQHGCGIQLDREPKRAAEQLSAYVGSSRVEAAGRAARELARTSFARDELYQQLVSVLANATR